MRPNPPRASCPGLRQQVSLTTGPARPDRDSRRYHNRTRRRLRESPISPSIPFRRSKSATSGEHAAANTDPTEPGTTEPGTTEPVRVARIKGTLADRLEVIVPLLGYLVTTITGMTTSAIGIALLRARPHHPLGLMFGQARAFRSDEWLTEAPIELGVLTHGSPVVSPLTHTPDLIYQVSSGGFFETLLFSEGNLLRLGPWVPDSMAFAAFRAFPILLVLLTMPPLLRRFGVNRPLSWLAVVLTLLAPAALWWSFFPIRILAFGVAGSYMLVLARDRFVRGSWVIGSLWAIVAGAYMARLGTYYVPWGLTIGVPIGAATAAFLLAHKETWRSGMRALATGATAAVVLIGGTFWENRAALQSELDTIYPGLRRVSGIPLDPFKLFGAPGLSVMQSTAEPIMSNKSEISSAFLIAGVLALVLWTHRRTDLTAPQRWVAWVLAGATLLWTSWATVDWGSLGSTIPVLSVVLPTRAAQTVGFLAVLLACVVLSQTAAEGRRRSWLLAGGVCALVTAYGTSSLSHVFPDQSTTTVWIASLVTGALVAVVTRWPDSWIPVVAVALACGLIGYRVNPIIFGLGDLRASAAAHEAQRLGTEARAAHTLVATDYQMTAALLVANGVPSLSGYQVTGPDRSAWHKLDPQNLYEQNWNRGASYLRLTFDGAPGAAPVVTNPGLDLVYVSVDPCTLSRYFPVTRIVSPTHLKQSCLTKIGTFRWSGVQNRVYAIAPVG